MEFENNYMRTYLNDEYKNNDILDELFIISSYNVVTKRVLDYYKIELRYTYPQLLANLNEILMSITKELLGQNNSLEQSLKSTIEQSDKSIWFK